MKKIISVFLALFITLIPVSCADNEAKDTLPQTNRPFSAVLDIEIKDFSADANLTYRSSASATLEITSPKDLETLVFNLEGEELSAKYKGLDFPLADTNGQAVSAARLIFSAIANAGNSKNAQIDKERDEFTVSGSVLSYNYEMEFDRMSGAIKSFTVPSQDLEVEFENFRFLG